MPAAEFGICLTAKISRWVNVNTDPDTWRVKDGLLICSGHPHRRHCAVKSNTRISSAHRVMHMDPGGNSGVFAWSSARPYPTSRLPDGIEVQMLELDWVNLNKRDGKTPHARYVHG